MLSMLVTTSHVHNPSVSFSVFTAHSDGSTTKQYSKENIHEKLSWAISFLYPRGKPNEGARPKRTSHQITLIIWASQVLFSSLATQK